MHFLSFSGHIRPFLGIFGVLEVWLSVAQICPPGLVDIAMDLQLFKFLTRTGGRTETEGSVKDPRGTQKIYEAFHF